MIETCKGEYAPLPLGPCYHLEELAHASIDFYWTSAILLTSFSSQFLKKQVLETYSIFQKSGEM